MIKISGHLRIFIDGVEVGAASNKVVFLGSEAMLRCLQGLAGFSLASFQAGTGTTAPTTSDTALGNSTYNAALASYSVTGSTTAEVEFSIAPGVIASTQNFTEFGLFCANGDMFARWCDGNTYTYLTTGTLSGVWTITISL